MRSRKKQVKIAKYLFKKSLSNSRLDIQKVRQALKFIIWQKPAGFITILKIYKRFISQTVAKEELIFETAAKIEKQKQLEAYLLQKTGATRIRHRVNPKIVFGAKIIHGDWVYDATLDSKLKQLTKA